ncbi:CDP-glycerol glycerophosphotransferase family protein [Sporolactobacillus sp. CQH2019]|uniref:CDP-glycerol glycerophosphotransferase family protein n=1 Tax=Sporolactobacillus sp. CQH2019 TaxID=3023512 RepID=UPI003FD46309
MKTEGSIRLRLKTHAAFLFKKWGRFVFRCVYRECFRLLGHLPADRNLVIFESFFGRQYSCNPRAIYEYMRENCRDYRLIWSADRRHGRLFEQHGVPYVRRYSLRWLLMMSRARYWVTNIRFPSWFCKSKHTIYLQTWHGTPLKRLGTDIEHDPAPGKDAEKYKRDFVKDSGMWDILISPNRYSSDIFTRAFAFGKTLLETGYPRNDCLYRMNRSDTVRAVKDKCGLPRDKKVILYAPTWRDDQFDGAERYRFDLHLDLERMRGQLADNYVIILRMHYLIAGRLDLGAYAGFAFDFSHYDDIRDLYLISDLLITDYSSVFFDYANLRRPMIFFAYDIDRYRDFLRGFYFDFEKTAPGPIVRTTDEVIQAVRETERPGFRLSENFEPFFQKFCSLEDGRATERVVRRVFGSGPAQTDF